MGASIIGARKIITVVYIAGSNITTIDPALPRTVIFTEKHYSMIWS